MSDEQHNEGQATVRELERLHKGVRRFNVIAAVSLPLAALVLLGLLFALFAR